MAEDVRTGVERIAAERTRQIEKHGWDPAHDDDHEEHELAWAAICYAAPERIFRRDDEPGVIAFVDPWPTNWDEEWDKRQRVGDTETGDLVSIELAVPTRDQYIRRLEKAGAMIAAEIDRLLRVGASIDEAKGDT